MKFILAIVAFYRGSPKFFKDRAHPRYAGDETSPSVGSYESGVIRKTMACGSHMPQIIKGSHVYLMDPQARRPIPMKIPECYRKEPTVILQYLKYPHKDAPLT
ncbi:hypothetical protein AMTR_s00129p00119690 [Amborella trichopoda]|uniref:Uncharacterized protein n=1 Tax=Amborella trichopoda TaxID=13333 RepID=W1NJW4_AMBTC|nr:hypothetical protein AMTR_s00129p00119690 [Amborella trichopoda]